MIITVDSKNFPYEQEFNIDSSRIRIVYNLGFPGYADIPWPQIYATLFILNDKGEHQQIRDQIQLGFLYIQKKQSHS